MNATRRLQILKFEGSSLHKNLACSILSNHKQIHSSLIGTLQAEKREFELAASSILEIRLKDPQRSDILGVNVPIHLLKVSHQWLPLFFASKIETLASLPDEVSTPRVLLKVSFKDFPGDKDEPCESEIKAIESNSPSHASDDSLNITSNSKKKFLMLDLLTKELETSSDKANQLSKKLEDLERKAKEADEQCSICYAQAGDREKQLLDLISAKDEEIQKTLKLNFALQSKLRLAETEKEHLFDQLQRKVLENERFKDTAKELEIFKNKLYRSEELQEKLTKALQKMSKNFENTENSEFQHELIIKEHELKQVKGMAEEIKKSGENQIAALKQEIKEIKSQLSISQEQERYLASKLLAIESEKMNIDVNTVISEFIEKEFAAIAKKNRAVYMKINDFTFQVKGKALSLAICRGGLFVRLTSGLAKLEDFFEDRHENPVSRPESSLSIHTDRSENHTNRSLTKISSHKSFLQSTKSSSNKVKPVNDKSTLQERNRIHSTDRKSFR
jgi:chromosome segregation ATPase